MRWLLLKDLQILRRSPLLVALLVLYPVAIALMVGFAVSSPPGKPKVAVYNQVAETDQSVHIGGRTVTPSTYARQLFSTVQQIPVDSEDAVRAKVRSGEALAGVVIPGDIITQLQNELTQGIGNPTIRVYVNGADPLERQFVDSVIEARVSDAQQALSTQILKVAVSDLRTVLEGGTINLAGQSVDLLGLRQAREVVRQARSSLPKGSPERQAIGQVIDFAGTAIAGLSFAGPVLRSIGHPLNVERTEVAGHTSPADAYAVAIAVTVSVMFVALLLAAGMLALEREEHAFGRLVRGLVTRGGLLAEKAVLAGACAAAAGLLLSIVVAIIASLRWGRFPLWLVALIVAGVAFGALGVALGALAREVRAASLMAFGLALPIAFIALLPASAVSTGVHDVLSVVSAIFPFKPALQAMDAALNGSTTPGLWAALGHLAIVGAAYGLLARVAVRRF